MSPKSPYRLLAAFALCVLGVALWQTPAEHQEASSPPPSAVTASAPEFQPRAGATTSSTETDRSEGVAVGHSAENATQHDRAVIAEWVVRQETPLIESARARAGHPGNRIRLDMGDRGAVAVVLKDLELLGEDEGVFTGSLEGRPDSVVVLSYVGNAQAGTIQIPSENRSINVQGTEDGLVRFTEIDLRHAPECGACPPAPRNPQTGTHASL